MSKERIEIIRSLFGSYNNEIDGSSNKIHD